ncbi:tetratricopeptide repeat protein [Adhaeribacter pallidiroseus]|uniref:Putative TPR repeat-containing protein n=1 Tax=Adhaeribacter pallidiroseus TaxID=2072847 RepID=A0A369QKU1_9BACT|nr:tetratricopeptide repeat protein [Adhaeribacter pallidiroseus]RDC65533.1 putative TPR repeat-containing protein [Adhaeribacter pallidiroseus]
MKILLLLALFFLLAGNTVVKAQKPQLVADTTLARKWYTQALTLQQKGSLDSANTALAKAAILYRKHQQWFRHLDCENKAARNLVSMGKYEAALQKASQVQQESKAKFGHDQSKEAADALHITGIVYYYKGEYDRALQFYQKALQLRRKILGDDHPGLCSSYNNIGIIYYRKGEYDQALKYYYQDLEISLKSSGKTHLDIAASYSNIGNVYFDKADYDQAFTFTQKAITLKLEALGESHPELANSYNTIGNIYAYKGELDKALGYNLKALHLWQKALGETHPYVGAAYNNIGDIYLDKGEYAQALDCFQKNLQIILKSTNEMHPEIAIVYHNIGNVYNKLGEYDQALQYLQKGLQIRQHHLGQFHDDVAESYNSIGDVYYDKGEYDQAMEYYQKDLQILLKSLGSVNPSLAASYNSLGAAYQAKGEYTKALKQYQLAILANVPSFKDTSSTSNPTLRNKSGIYLDGTYLLTSFHSKASIFEKFYVQSRAKADLQLAYHTYCAADTLASQIQYNYSEENDKVAFTSKARQLYQTALAVCLKLHDLTKEKIYLDKAFYFAERGKASVLSATLAESKAKTFAGIADSLLTRDQQLRTSMATYNQQLAQELTKGATIDSSKLNEYQTRLFAASQQQEQLIHKLEKSYPSYYNLKYQFATITPVQLQKTLDEKTALVEYALGDTLLQVFTLTQDTFKVQSFSLDPSFHRKIAAFRKAILSQDEGLYRRVAYSLYKILVPPDIPKSIRQLIIIPEGELTNLPFEALLTQNKKTKALKLPLTY